MPNWFHTHAESRATSETIADHVAGFIGSWKFIAIQSSIFVAWVILNSLWLFHAIVWDPYPYILFNLFMSAEAAYATPLIMMSQNRQSDRDRHQAEADYQTNLAAKEEIEALQRDLARIESEKLDQILSLLDPEKFSNLERRVRRIEFNHIQEAHRKV